MSVNGVTLGKLIIGEVKAVRSSNTGFSRLKGIFTQGLNYKTYDEFIGMAKNKTLGNIPDDILRAAIQTPDKKSTILKIQKGFSKAVDELHKNQEFKKDVIKNLIPSKEEILKLYKQIFNGNQKALLQYQKKMIKTLVPRKQEAILEKNAMRIIQQSMKDVLPKGAKLKIKYLSEGSFGKGYKIEFLNKDGEKVYRDLVLKVFKDSEREAELMAIFTNNVSSTLNQIPDEQMVKLLKRTKALKQFDKKEIKTMVSDLKKNLQSLKKEQIKSMLLENFNEMKQIHGAAAEANSAAYIKRVAGHPLTNTDFNRQYMFDLKQNFSLAPFADETLPPVTKRLHLEKLGIIENDIFSNASNTVAGRVIDMGGMSSLDSNLQDKTVLKYFKKILNRNTKKEQDEVIENLKKLTENPKTPNRNKIKKSIEIAELHLQNTTEKPYVLEVNILTL